MKICEKCGVPLATNAEKCSICGAPVPTNDSDNPFASISSFGKNAPKKDKNAEELLERKFEFLLKDKKEESPSTTNSKDFFSRSNSNNKLEISDHNLGILVCVFVGLGIVVIGGVLLFINNVFFKDKPVINSSNEIKLTEPSVEDPSNQIEEPTQEPDLDPDPDPITQDPVEDPNQDPEPVDKYPNTFERKLNNYVMHIPNKYKVTDYQDSGITLLDNSNGTTISIIPGVFDLATYRSKKDELSSQMQEGGTIVNRIYDSTISGRDLHIMELTQDDFNYIMAIISVNQTQDTFLLVATDLANKKKYNYDILTEAVNIITTIE